MSKSSACVCVCVHVFLYSLSTYMLITNLSFFYQSEDVYSGSEA